MHIEAVTHRSVQTCKNTQSVEHISRNDQIYQYLWTDILMWKPINVYNVDNVYI